MEKKTIITIILALLSVFILGLILCYVYKLESEIIFTATVKEVNQSNYIITPESEDLPNLISIELDKEYNVGDLIEIKASNMMLETYPVTMKAISHKLIKKNAIETDATTTEIIKPPESFGEEENIIENDIVQIEEAIISDFSNYINAVNNYETNPDSKTRAKNHFIKVVDFIFYDTEISGYKFMDLTNKGKLKVIKLALELDNVINNKFPNYKSELEAKYINMKGKLVSLYLDKTYELCQNNDLVCSEAKANFLVLKKNLNLTWSFITSIGEKSVKELQNWYEIFSGK
ncbi:MAG: hypothetical protein PHX04_00205 [Bacilli bacterium]|nr:hypothetical protein [Bacilli bacterium]